MEQDNRDNKYFDLDSVNPMGTQMERTTSTKKRLLCGRGDCRNDDSVADSLRRIFGDQTAAIYRASQ